VARDHAHAPKHGVCRATLSANVTETQVPLKIISRERQELTMMNVMARPTEVSAKATRRRFPTFFVGSPSELRFRLITLIASRLM
jgi:hypothetical protein